MKKIEFKLASLAAVICFAAFSVETVYAQEEQTQDKNGWDFRIGWPLWASGVKGTIGVRNREVEIDEDFWDVLDTLDLIVPLNLEIRKSRFLFFSDGLYVKTSTSGEPGGLFSGAQVDLDQKLMFDDLAIGFAVVKNECFSLELFAGAQLVWAETDLELEAPVADRKASNSEFWADPIVGAYLNYRFPKLVGLYVKGDVGGFDVSSHLTWQIEGGLDFAIARHCYVRLAYRYLNTDHDSGGFSYDVSLHGPQLEVGVKF